MSRQPDESVFRAIRSEDLEWKPFAAFPSAARLAVLVGDPNRPGPYVIRVRLPAGTRMMPHKHPEDRIYTVLSGVFYIGLGEEFDESRLTAYGVCSSGRSASFPLREIRRIRHASHRDRPFGAGLCSPR